MITRLKQLISGLSIPQEYCCIGLETFTDSLTIVVVDKNGIEHDVSDRNILLGYRPLLLGLVLKNGETSPIDLKFKHNDQVVARLKMKRVDEIFIENDTITIFEGVSGSHSFISSFHQFSNRVRNILKRNKPGNVALPGNLYDQVRIGYAVPRTIAVISVGDGKQFNMFPTDLHGVVNTKYYISSLRIDGLANKQVEAFKKITISEVPDTRFRETYLLGKNHMQPLSDESSFQVDHERSQVFVLPLPLGVLKYRELELLKSIDHGIHRIHLYRIVNDKNVLRGTTLAHIHQYYAQWRYNNGLATKLLLR